MIRKINRKDDYIIIIGCGRLGSHLANLLSASKKSIVIIDKNEESFKRLNPNFSGFTIEADAIEEEVLEEAKIDQADVVVSVTNDDNTNIMIAQIAKKIYNIPKVIARLVEPNKQKIYDKLGIVTICPTILSAEEISKTII
ncbi:MAG: potassium transporter TrkA [Actinobacteria bacterium RBG_19FT_COMBO_36_27]|nr:MAG: potassium transporter TrkA [Actinobacteria bacterium RBG_19FT_COMBO_36_27]